MSGCKLRLNSLLTCAVFWPPFRVTTLSWQVKSDTTVPSCSAPIGDSSCAADQAKLPSAFW
ncbi:hypothetical protein VCHC47A1_2946, partial [Vibrio cholerae HC-47A1]